MSKPVSDSGGNFEKPPIGMQQAVCVFIHDIGLQESQYKGEKIVADKTIITFELSEKMSLGEYAGKPFFLSKWYTRSLSEKANLRKDLESWRGVAFTQEELKSFDLDKLIGANCFLNVTENEDGGRKISAITPMPKGVAKILPTSVIPSEKFLEFIQKQRDKAVHPTEQDKSTATDSAKDDLPF